MLLITSYGRAYITGIMFIYFAFYDGHRLDANRPLMMMTTIEIQHIITVYITFSL